MRSWLKIMRAWTYTAKSVKGTHSHWWGRTHHILATLIFCCVFSLLRLISSSLCAKSWAASWPFPSYFSLLHSSPQCVLPPQCVLFMSPFFPWIILGIMCSAFSSHAFHYPLYFPLPWRSPSPEPQPLSSFLTHAHICKCTGQCWGSNSGSSCW